MFTQEEAQELLLAALDSRLEDCQRIVHKCSKDIITVQCKASDYGGLTPLHCAADMLGTEVLEWFLEQQIDCEALDESGATALMYAANWGRTAAVRLLLQAGANPQLPDRVRGCCLMFSVRS
eukprot:m.238323 g.238323  ORF g.238323 m.238323 type:complete len:122 (+) comp54353_c0_seq10:95-460(+)